MLYLFAKSATRLHYAKHSGIVASWHWSLNAPSPLATRHSVLLRSAVPHTLQKASVRSLHGRAEKSPLSPPFRVSFVSPFATLTRPAVPFAHSLSVFGFFRLFLFSVFSPFRSVVSRETLSTFLYTIRLMCVFLDLWQVCKKVDTLPNFCRPFCLTSDRSPLRATARPPTAGG